jgi:hypothetical protein
MAMLIEERSGVSRSFPMQEVPHTDGAGQPPMEKGRFRQLRTWFVRLGEFLFGLGLAFLGFLVRAALTVALLAAPLIALVGTVLLFALLIEGTGVVLRAIGLTP